MLSIIQMVNVNKEDYYPCICNLFAQDNYGYDGRQYTSIEALKSCFEKLAAYAEYENLTIAIPYKIGCCRGGVDWNEYMQ